MSHFHIQWNSGKLDWQAFQTEEEARSEAERLKGQDEKYTIVQIEGVCPQCSRIEKP